MQEYFSKSDGTVWSVGHGQFGQNGDGTLNDSVFPVQMQDGNGDSFDGVVEIAGSWEHSVMLKNDGTVWAVGWNGGRLGDGTSSDSRYPVQVKDSNGSAFNNVSKIGATLGSTYYLKHDGTVWANGTNDVGELGDGTIGEARYFPVPLIDEDNETLSNVSDFSVRGSNQKVFIKNDGSLLHGIVTIFLGVCFRFTFQFHFR